MPGGAPSHRRCRDEWLRFYAEISRFSVTVCRCRPPSIDYQLKRGESDMRKIITTTFVTLDGVMQAPGGPEEDASGGFKYGGWQAHVMDNSLGEALNELMKPPFSMLLGHNTYNIFAGFWPKQDPNNAIAKPFNDATKYVVSHEPFEPDWVNTKVVSGDVPAALRRLKAEDGPDMIVWGSGNLIQ